MDRLDFTHLTAPVLPLHQLKTLILMVEAKEVILRHGCKLNERPDECIISFPEGTTRREIYPRTISEHYQINLPDGYILYEDYDRWRKISLLRYSPERR